MGALNNELYIGRRVWNRLKYELNSETERYVSRLRSPSERVISKIPHLRMIAEDLWVAVKARQGAYDTRRARGAEQSRSIK